MGPEGIEPSLKHYFINNKGFETVAVEYIL